MPSNYPSALDDFAENSPSFMSDPDTTGRVHSRRHDDVESGLEAVQAFIGARRDANAKPAQVKWDESVGRRMFVWDTVNSRWQMVFGETGARNISSLLMNGWTGSYTILRSDNRVTHNINVNGASATGTQILTPPAGFQVTTEPQTAVAYNTAVGLAALYIGGGEVSQMFPGFGTQTSFQATFHHMTGAPWPTSLPGTAIGTIPAAGEPQDTDPNIPSGLPE